MGPSYNCRQSYPMHIGWGWYKTCYSTNIQIAAYKKISNHEFFYLLGIIDSYGIEGDIRASSANSMDSFFHTIRVGCMMSILRPRRWWKGVMPFLRRWLDLAHSFGTILRKGRMATIYPAEVVGRHLLSVVRRADVHHGCCRWEEGVDEGLRQASEPAGWALSGAGYL